MYVYVKLRLAGAPLQVHKQKHVKALLELGSQYRRSEVNRTWDGLSPERRFYALDRAQHRLIILLILGVDRYVVADNRIYKTLTDCLQQGPTKPCSRLLGPVGTCRNLNQQSSN